MELDTFFFCVVYFFNTSRKFGFRTTVDNVSFSSQTKRGARGVHRDVAAADHSDFLTAVDGCIIIFKGCHEIVAGQVFVS